MAAADGATLGAGASRPASLVVGGAVAGGLTLVAATGGGAAVGLTAASGGLLGVAVLCRAREGPAAAAAASALVPVVALAGLGGTGLLVAARVDPAALGRPLALLPALALALGTGLAAFGAAGTLGDGIGDGAVARTWRSATASASVVGVALLARLASGPGALPAPAVDVGGLLAPLLAPVGPTLGLATFATLVGAAALAGRAAVSALPVVELTPRRRRDDVRAAVERVAAALLTAAKYGALAALASVLTVLPPVRAAIPVAALAALVASSALRSGLLALAVAAGGVALASRLLRAAAGETAATLGRLLPATAGGVGVVLLAAAGGGVVRPLVGGLPAGVRPVAASLLAALSPAGLVLGVALVALVALTALLTALVAAGGAGLLPTRGSGGALAGVGLGAVATVLGVGGADPLVTFALVGLAVVAWDASDRGVSARADLGPRSAARIEAVHAVASVGVATVGVAAAWAVTGLVGAVPPPDGALVGAVVAVAGAVVLIGLLRG
ncbi:hypothetical protein [Haloplanus halophilus]|uniref:hypothetical protein n=1 Tax=Haloplanus halophilus TaxID=2949993 RepID=UPI00203E8698|nr:hypothetical protein [Haloplanus sp. GDY1]